jgi:plasmid stabilization system protein ParE
VTYTLRWSERAANDYERLVDYLIEKWGMEITLDITHKFERAFSQIEKYPEHYPVFLGKKNIRRHVVSPQTSIFFKVENDVIEIITLFDNRQSPEKRKL